MKPPPFEYLRAGSVEEALEALDGETKVLAGGQSLLPLLNYRLARPARLVDVDRLEELAGIDVEDGVRVGALTRHAAVERDEQLAGPWQALRVAAAHVGHYPIRTRGTFGGSIAHADPAAELCLAALTFDADVVVRSRTGTRRIAAADFFAGPFATALADDELVTEIVFPAGATASVFEELAPRTGDFALASVCVVQTARGVAIGLGSVGPTPLRARSAEEARASGEPVSSVARAAAQDCDPTSDSHATAEYRRALVATLVERALLRLEATA